MAVIVNRPERYGDDMLEGLVAANPELVIGGEAIRFDAVAAKETV